MILHASNSTRVVRQEEKAAASHPYLRESVGRRRTMMQVQGGGPSACDNVTSFFCWMSCRDIPALPQHDVLNGQDLSLQCLDPNRYDTEAGAESLLLPALKACDGGWKGNPDCRVQWVPTRTLEAALALPATGASGRFSSSSSSAARPFCSGGTAMYMHGFMWMDETCVIFLFPTWVLSTPGRFALACLITIGLGIALEWVLLQRRHWVKYEQRHAKAAAAAIANGGLGTPYPIANHHSWWGVSTALHMVQLTMGYFLMLIVMTYNIPLYVQTKLESNLCICQWTYTHILLSLFLVCLGLFVVFWAWSLETSCFIETVEPREPSSTKGTATTTTTILVRTTSDRSIPAALEWILFLSTTPPQSIVKVLPNCTIPTPMPMPRTRCGDHTPMEG